MLFPRMIKHAVVSGVFISTSFFFTNIFAGGFQIWEQDLSGVGDYHAGAAAEADTAGSEFYNPAGITRIHHQQISFGAALIGLAVNYTGTATIFNLPVDNQPGNTTNIVPNFHYVLPLPHHFAFAFGVTTPFGLSTEYYDSYPVNLLATTTQLQTINLNPGIAYEINRYLSLGFGFDALYGSADYDADVFGTINSDLSGVNYGYNAGALVQFTPHTRMGLSYRSAITIDAKGPSSCNSLNTIASANFPLPATSTVSLYQDVTPKITLMTSAFYTQWSSFKQLIINNLATSGGIGTIRLNENYRDTWNLALGGKYKLNKHISIDAGFGHDQTPTQVGYRDIRLPDNNHYAASLGIDVIPSPNVQWTMGWTHLFVPTTPIDNSKSDDGSTPIAPSVGIGTEKGSVDVFGIEMSCNI